MGHIGLIKDCICMFLKLLILLELSLESIVLEWVFRCHLFGVIRCCRSMRWIRFYKFSYFLLKFCFLFVASYAFTWLTDLACIVAGLKATSRGRSIISIVGYGLYFILLEDRQSQDFIFEVVFFILIVVADSWIGAALSFASLSLTLSIFLSFSHQFAIL